MREELTPTGRVILGMIRLGRRTGYDIKLLVDRSTRFFWAASYGQIYPELKRLEAEGLVTGADEPSGGRRRTVYELTPGGEEALDDWLRSDAELAYELRDEGLLKLFFAGELPREDQLRVVRAARASHERVLDTLREVEPAARAAAAEAGGESFPLIVLDSGLALHGFFIDLYSKLEERLAAAASAKKR